MDILITLILFFVLFIFSAIKSINVAYILFLALIVFMFLAIKRGFNVKQVLIMVYGGGKKSFLVIEIFILIGAIISLWLSAGTVSAIVYYGITYLNPKLFIVSAFLINCVLSVLIGTSFGVVGTVGVALMVMARSGGVNLTITAGAIIAGAYFGDRCSPMSSSANLVAYLTETSLYGNVKNMIKTSIIPLIITIVIYTIISIKNPLLHNNSVICNNIASYFNISVIVLVPAFVILILSLFKVNVKVSMLISILFAILITIIVQKHTVYDTFKFIIFGYNLDVDADISKIIKGGGIISMLKVAIIVFISSAFTGIFEETGMLMPALKLMKNIKSRLGVYCITVIISILTAAFGCTQSLAIILTNILTRDLYLEKRFSKEQLALDIENTAVVISPLIPWNIALLVPLTTLMVDFHSIIFSVYLYLVPISNFIYLFFKFQSRSKFLYKRSTR